MNYASLRNRLLVGTLLPVLVLTVVEMATLHQTLTQTIREAYDRLLLAAVYSVADSLHTEGGQLRGALPLALREAFEAAGGSRVYYRISSISGSLISGDSDLPIYAPDSQAVESGFRPVVPTLTQASMQGAPVRMVVLYQPVEMSGGQQVALIQVAHTLEARDQAARIALLRALARQIAFVVLMALTIWLMVVRLLKPVDRLRREVDARAAADLSPLRTPELRELNPVVRAFNLLMSRQALLLRQQERFVADASHQLRTPLTVLKTQLQSLIAELPGAATEHDGLTDALKVMERTLDRVNALAQQMLSLAKVHQASARGNAVAVNFARVVEEAALELSPLLGQKRIVFSLQQTPAHVLADDWMPGELVRNVLQNAIRFTPAGGRMAVTVGTANNQALLIVEDSGPGVPEALLDLVFEPFFSTPGQRAGSGLGLAICRDITNALGGTIELENVKRSDGAHMGCRVCVMLPKA